MLLLSTWPQVYPSSAAQNSFVISTTCSRSHVNYFLDKQSKAHYNSKRLMLKLPQLLLGSIGVMPPL